MSGGEALSAAELAPGLWAWHQAHPEWTPAADWPSPVVGSWYVETAEALVLVDALAPAEGSAPAERFWRHLDADVERLGLPVAVVVSKPDHLRSAAVFERRYRERSGARVYAGEGLRSQLPRDAAFAPLRAGDTLPGGITAHDDGRGRGETPLHLPRQRALIVADALISLDGELHVWWAPGYDERVLPALRRLLALPIDMVLPSHGPAILEGGGDELRAALERKPWRG